MQTGPLPMKNSRRGSPPDQ